ncbi:hypothetical protein [Massilia sp. S19_KUP03_FR1]|uniref:hypothetical protein n=1 Tax=Massilia sp. S19_KUP03_FR1 TaxID=3025503 RepID=UPI002FCDB974
MAIAINGKRRVTMPLATLQRELAAIQIDAAAASTFAGSIPPVIAWRLVARAGVLLVDVRWAEQRHFSGSAQRMSALQ